MEFDFSEGDLEVIGFEKGHRVWEQCVTVTHQWTHTYDWRVTAWDLGWKDGAVSGIEDLLADSGQDAESRDDFCSPSTSTGLKR